MVILTLVAVWIGIYSYALLVGGLIGILTPINILTFTLGFLLLIFFLSRVSLKKWFSSLKNVGSQIANYNLLEKLSLLLLVFFVLVNFLNCLTPEIGFDALWYHLSLPKIYLDQQKIIHFKNNPVFSYSTFPRLTEMLYTSALAFWDERLAKLIHFSFGILGVFALGKLLRRKFSFKLSLLGVLIFYSQLTVSWLSSSAYIDLARTFFEILALYWFLEWIEGRKQSSLIKSALAVGLAISTKWLSFASVFVFLFLIIFFIKKDKIKSGLVFFTLALLISLPWLIISFQTTGNPVYPLFTDWFFKTQSNGLSFLEWLQTRNLSNLFLAIFKTSITQGDILTPFFLIGLPLILREKIYQENKIIFTYFWLNFLIWFFLPLNYNRFLLSYIPAFIYLFLAGLRDLGQKSGEKFLIWLVFLVAAINLGARGIILTRNLNFILGRQTKAEYLKERLDFSTSNFFDLDGWFAENIGKNDRVLVIGVWKLFYLDFPYDHFTWRQKDLCYSHILIQGQPLPEEFEGAKLVYENPLMKIKVFIPRCQLEKPRFNYKIIRCFRLV